MGMFAPRGLVHTGTLCSELLEMTVGDDNILGESCGNLCSSFRVVLYAWEFPAPLESFVVPNDINWSLTEDLQIDLHEATHVSEPGQCWGRPGHKLHTHMGICSKAVFPSYGYKARGEERCQCNGSWDLRAGQSTTGQSASAGACTVLKNVCLLMPGCTTLLLLPQIQVNKGDVQGDGRFVSKYYEDPVLVMVSVRDALLLHSLREQPCLCLSLQRW
jgi:hypothetical protein